MEIAHSFWIIKLLFLMFRFYHYNGHFLITGAVSSILIAGPWFCKVAVRSQCCAVYYLYHQGIHPQCSGSSHSDRAPTCSCSHSLSGLTPTTHSHTCEICCIHLPVNHCNTSAVNVNRGEKWSRFHLLLYFIILLCIQYLFLLL